MIVVGTLAALLSGVGLPGHILMFGEIIDHFISFDLANQIRDANNITNRSDALMFISDSNGSALMIGPGQEYFCPIPTDPESSNIFLYVTADDLGSVLQSEVATFSYYYLVISFALLLLGFTANFFWNTSSFRQARRMRLAFYRAILKQDIGWFDVNPAGQLSTRLSE